MFINSPIIKASKSQISLQKSLKNQQSSRHKRYVLSNYFGSDLASVRLFDGIFSKNPKRKSKNQNRLNSKIQSLHGKRIAPFC
jgi:hypothetical protein